MLSRLYGYFFRFVRFRFQSEQPENSPGRPGRIEAGEANAGYFIDGFWRIELRMSAEN